VGANAQVNETFYLGLLDKLNDGVYFVDADMKITYWNKAAERIVGFAASECVGAHCGEHGLNHMDAHGVSLCRDGCPLEAALRDGGGHEVEAYLRHKDGHRVPVLLRAAPISGPQGRVVGAVGVFSDASSRVAAIERIRKLREMALLDPLTGVGNRRYTGMNIAARLDENRRYGWPFGLLFIDIDRFKNVNDAHGHEVGDEVLKMVARTLLNSFRPFDFVGRWGGEEFIALIVNVGDERLRGVAERARSLVGGSHLRRASDPVGVTVSIGAAVARPADTVGSLVDRADQLMYHSKQLGRNRVTVEGD
jgi:diguanylate cyclase (GGDEF)-like protein/PAS domain S-box-containing protein